MKRINDKLNTLIGRRLREARILQGMTLTQLGAALGMSFQAIQKYESGEINIVPPKLKRLAEILEVSIGYFFDVVEMPPQSGRGSQRRIMEIMRKLLQMEQHQPEAFQAICDMVKRRTKLQPCDKNSRSRQPSQSRNRQV